MTDAYNAQHFEEHVDRARTLLLEAANQERDHRIVTLAEAQVHALLAKRSLYT